MPPPISAASASEVIVRDGVARLSETPILRAAWRRGASVRVHGLIYGIRDGLLRDLDCSVGPAAAMESA